MRVISLMLFLCPALALAATPKNMVLVIGDGMGPAYTTAYRYYADDPATKAVETTIFDDLLVGMASTYPDEDETVVTDSAAAATALASGHKSYNGAIGVDRQGQPLSSLLAKAHALGMATGVAVTSQINHATPAAFLAHNADRDHYNEIADSYLAEPIADLMFGGGLEFFRRPDRDLVAAFEKRGYQFAANATQLDQLNQLPVLGLFAPVGMPPAIDDLQGPRLLATTAKALELLDSRDQGFVLMVECSQIDWGGHANDIVVAMHEMDECARTLQLIRDFAASRGNTLVVATADHSTGGLSVAANGDYDWNPDVVKGVTHSPAWIADQLATATEWPGPLATMLGFAPTSDELALLTQARTSGSEPLAKALRSLIDQRSRTGWTTHGHTADDVQIFAFGPGSEQFHGHLDNVDIANRMAGLLPPAAK